MYFFVRPVLHHLRADAAGTHISKHQVTPHMQICLPWNDAMPSCAVDKLRQFKLGWALIRCIYPP